MLDLALFALKNIAVSEIVNEKYILSIFIERIRISFQKLV